MSGSRPAYAAGVHQIIATAGGGDETMLVGVIEYSTHGVSLRQSASAESAIDFVLTRSTLQLSCGFMSVSTDDTHTWLARSPMTVPTFGCGSTPTSAW